MNRRDFGKAALAVAVVAVSAPEVLSEQRRIIGRYIEKTAGFQCVWFGRNDGLRACIPLCKDYNHEMYSACENHFLTIRLPRSQKPRLYSFEDFKEEVFKEQQFWLGGSPEYHQEILMLEKVG
jgi:hypothetical protein